MTTKAIGYFLEEKIGQLARGEALSKRVPIYETRSRNGHTQAKVFTKDGLVWSPLPIEADPQHTKDPSLVLTPIF